MKKTLRRWRIKLFSWEYWPWQIVYLPVFIYYLFLAIRSRSLLYTCGANPSIRNGGMIGESKFDILRLVPGEYRPAGILLKNPPDPVSIRKILGENDLRFPLIAKPDVGERGFMVKKIESFESLSAYSAKLGHPFILQEYIDLPLEAGIFYYRIPGEESGHITSVVIKKMLTITGDGQKTLEELVLENDRAFLQLEILREKFAGEWLELPENGKEIELISIGNHCLGTTFLNGNHLITGELRRTMDSLSRRIKGFYYGRFDVRSASEESLQTGNFKVLELNGAAAEPAHIYHPGASFIDGQKTLFRHWAIMYRISRINKRNMRFPTIGESFREYSRFRALKSVIQR